MITTRGQYGEEEWDACFKALEIATSSFVVGTE